jgi:phage terminase large subunit
MVIIRRKLLPKQFEFLRCPARECLYSGAFGAGKSRALCEKLIQRASVPGARELLCRKVNVSLRDTTLQTLLEPDGELDPVLPEGQYIHFKSDQKIRIIGGGEIIYKGLDLATKIGSLQLTGIAIDEAIEIDESMYTMLRGRIRVKVPGLKNQINMACNPGSPSHFLAQRFGLAPDTVCIDTGAVISTNSFENTYLDKEYVEDLRTLSGVFYQRYVEGKWVGAEGLIYDKWNRTVHVQARREKQWKFSVIAIDDGYVNPFVALLICIDGDGRIHVKHEIYATNLLTEDKVDAVKSLMKINGDTDLNTILVDPSSADLIADFVSNDIPAQGANNFVFGGIVRTQGFLPIQKDNRPKLTVDPECVNTIREFESYEWNANGKDEPVKKYDHTMDALRYAVNYLHVYGIDGSSVVRI